MNIPYSISFKFRDLVFNPPDPVGMVSHEILFIDNGVLSTSDKFSRIEATESQHVYIAHHSTILFLVAMSPISVL